MNPLLAKLHPYPFERLRELTRDITPNPACRPISLGIGEPKHPTPDAGRAGDRRQPGRAVVVSGHRRRAGAAAGDGRLGAAALRRALDPATQVLPVNGSREALFALAQTVIDPTRDGATVVCPNPFYQIYEGAALLAGAQTVFAPSDPQRNFAADWSTIADATWRKTQLLYVCSPGNPTGAVMPLAEWQALFELSDRHGFVIASDECYSEIYFRDEPPLGSLQAAKALGRDDFRRLIAFTSLSKRSNVPGMRSGFVAGDAALIRQFLLYRTYHGSAMGLVVQRASIAAWNDEAHVVANRQQYRDKFAQVTPVARRGDGAGACPTPAFICGRRCLQHCFGGDDVAFALELLAQYNVAVLPGSLLAREVAGNNPGRGRIRLALVAPVAECLEAAERIAAFVRGLSNRLPR